MARHGCGVFGNSAEKFDTSFVDRIDHLFDCIEIDQTFSFYDGKAYFSSRFYDSNIARIFRDIYDQVLSVNLRLPKPSLETVQDILCELGLPLDFCHLFSFRT